MYLEFWILAHVANFTYEEKKYFFHRFWRVPSGFSIFFLSIFPPLSNPIRVKFKSTPSVMRSFFIARKRKKSHTWKNPQKILFYSHISPLCKIGLRDDFGASFLADLFLNLSKKSGLYESLPREHVAGTIFLTWTVPKLDPRPSEMSFFGNSQRF